MHGKRKLWRIVAGGMLGGAGVYMLLNCGCDQCKMKKLKRSLKSKAAKAVGTVSDGIAWMLTGLGNMLSDICR